MGPTPGEVDICSLAERGKINPAVRMESGLTQRVVASPYKVGLPFYNNREQGKLTAQLGRPIEST
ncbi:MAG: transcriptional regulator [Betaproteobacteria bacterium]|nr:transcriptional regulator [Betaproteobacteria bacterium]